MNRRDCRVTMIALLFVLLGAPAQAQDDAEDLIYEMFNDLNPDDNYDMICKREVGTGSQFRRRVCKPRMLRDPDLVYRTDGAFERPAAADKQIYRDQRQKMLDAAAENPELLELMVSRVKMLRIYNQRKRKES